MASVSPADLDRFDSPLDSMLGVKVTEASGEVVVAVLEVAPHLHQPTGIVHGGVYATLVESTASIGASIAANAVAVGVSNHTDFIRAVREGILRAEARPRHVGRSLQLWHV